MSDGSVPALLPELTRPPVSAHDLLLLDLDGVVYAGPQALPGAAAAIDAARSAGAQVGFVTNNASRPPAEVAAHLTDLGVAAAPDDVVTSAQAAARLVAELVPPGSRVLVVGGAGLVDALAEHDLTAVWSATDDPVAVVQGFHPTVGWPLLAEGAYAVAAGLPWVASNLDLTVPTDRGRAPGNGTLVEAVATASRRRPTVAGKPEPALLNEATARLQGQRPLVVGDRLDTDVAGAIRADLPSLLVLTGVAGLADVCAAEPDVRPTYVSADLGGLLVPHPAVRVDGAGAHCDGWRAELRAGAVHLERADTPSGDASLAALRAVVAACWQAPDGQDVDTSAAEQRLHELVTGPAEEVASGTV